MQNRFALMVEKLFKEEGIYSNEPLDIGGETIYGISSTAYPREFLKCLNLYNRNYLNLAKEYAIKFYKKEFWNPLYEKIIDSSLCYRLFDFGVNAGINTAVKLLQKAIINYKTIAVDGHFGEITLAAINVISKESGKGEAESFLYNSYIKEIEKYYRSLKTFNTFGKGWINRLRRIFNL